jgi:CxxC motif-containing protein
MIMHEIKEFVCTVCPNGCILTVEIEDKQVTKITGNDCPRGAVYGKEEAIAPMRILTTTVQVIGAKFPVVSVKTSGRILKSLLFDVMKQCNQVSVQAPVKIGDVLIHHVLGTNVDIIATKNS